LSAFRVPIRRGPIVAKPGLRGREKGHGLGEKGVRISSVEVKAAVNEAKEGGGKKLNAYRNFDIRSQRGEREKKKKGPAVSSGKGASKGKQHAKKKEEHGP